MLTQSLMRFLVQAFAILLVIGILSMRGTTLWMAQMGGLLVVLGEVMVSVNDLSVDYVEFSRTAQSSGQDEGH